MAQTDCFTRPNGMTTVASFYWPRLLWPDTWKTRLILVVQFLTGLLTASKSALFRIANSDVSWIIVSYSTPAIVVASFYILAIMTVVALQIHLWRNATGLREDWQPECLADIIALFGWCTLPMDALHSHHSRRTLRGAKRRVIGPMKFCIGYWKRTDLSSNQESVVYSIGTIDQTSTTHQSDGIYGHPLHRGYPYRFSPFLSKFFVSLYTIVSLGGLVLLLTLAALGKVRNDIDLTQLVCNTDNATSASLAINISSSGTEPSGVRWSRSPHANPTMLATFILRVPPLLVLSIILNYSNVLDTCFRCTQPLHNVLKGPAKAEQSILLRYLTQNAVQVMIEALDKKHWKVFAYSLLATLSPLLVLIPFDLLQLTYTTERRLIVRIALYPYIGTVSVVAIMICALAVAFPQDRRKLPRPDFTLIDIWSMCHASFLTYQDFFGYNGKEWSKDMLHSAIKLRQHQYSLGICHGVDGVERLRFDITLFGPDQRTMGWVERIDPLSWWRQLLDRGGTKTGPVHPKHALHEL